MAFLDFLTTKRSPQSLELKKAFDAARFGISGIPAYPDTDREALMEWGRKNELAFACIRKKCEAAVDPMLVVEKFVDGDWASVEGHPLLAMLNRPNPRDTWDTFLTQWIQSEELTGDFYAEIIRTNGVPSMMYPLNPACMFVIPGRNGDVAYYEFRSGYAPPIRLAPEDIFHRWRPDPRSKYYGLSPTKVAIAAIDSDQSQTDFVRAFFHSDGVPAGILKFSDRTMSQEEAERNQQGWMARYRRGGSHYKQVAVLDENADFQKIGSNLKEIESDAVRGQSETRICMAYGVPPALVGAYVGLKLATNNATMKSHQKDFWDNTMSPLLKSIRVWLTQTLLTEFEDINAIRREQIRVNWDTTQVMAMQEDDSQRHNRVRDNFTAGIITLNEARDKTGEEPVADGDYFMQPNNLAAMTEVVRALIAAKEPAPPPAPVMNGNGNEPPPKQLEAGKRREPLEGTMQAALEMHLKNKSFDYNGMTLSREPTAIEQQIDLKAMLTAYDTEKARINNILLGIRKNLIKQSTDAVSKLGSSDIYTLTLTPPSGAAGKLKAEIAKAVQIGRDQVIADLAAQKK